MYWVNISTFEILVIHKHPLYSFILPTHLYDQCIYPYYWYLLWIYHPLFRPPKTPVFHLSKQSLIGHATLCPLKIENIFIFIIMTDSDLVKFIVCFIVYCLWINGPLFIWLKRKATNKSLSPVEIVCKDNMHRTILYRVQCTVYTLHTVTLTKYRIFDWQLNFNHWEDSIEDSVDFVFNGTGFTS